jgi:hypothetical protein
MKRILKRITLPSSAAALFASLLMSAPLAAQGLNITAAQPTSDQEQTPGLQQTPEGQTMKTAGEGTKTFKETQAAPVGGTGSTGPTFPTAPAGK